MRSTLIVSSICSLLLPACSGGLSDEDAAVAFASTYVVLAQGSSQASVVASSTPIVAADESDIRDVGVQPRAGASVDYTYNCTTGGTARYLGTAESVSEGPGAGSVNFTLATTFDACDTGGLTISGDLDYASSIVVTADTATTELTMKGSLSYEGQVDGSCDWDLTMRVAASGLGGGGGSVSAEYSGSICGHKAAATLNVKG